MGGESCTVLRLRSMHKLAMSHIGQTKIYHYHSLLKFGLVQPFFFFFLFFSKTGGYFHSRAPKLGRMVPGYALKSPRGCIGQIVESPVYQYRLLSQDSSDQCSDSSTQGTSSQGKSSKEFFYTVVYCKRVGGLYSCLL